MSNLDVPAWALMGLVLFVGLRWLAPPGQALPESALVWASVFVLALFASCVGFYASTPVLLDHVEPGTLSIAAGWRQGQPLYPPPDAAERYAYQYGPYLYVSHALAFAIAGPSLQAGKLPAVLSILAALGLMFRLVAARSNERVALLATAYLAVGILVAKPDPHGGYWCRPEPQLVLAVALGWNAAYAGRRLAAALLCGVALGVAANEKFFAAAYFLPILLVLYDHHGIRGAAVACLTAAVTLALPFVLVPGVSATNYLAGLRAATQHGFSLSFLPDTLRVSLFLALPFAALLAAGRFRIRRPVWALGTVTAYLVVVFFSSKLGAGPYYLLPLLPSAAVLLSETLADVRGKTEVIPWRRAAAPALIGAFVIVALVACLRPQAMVAHMQLDRLDQCREGIEEMEAARARYPGEGVGIAPGGADTYPQTFLRPWLVSHGEMNPFDPGAMMDYQRSGLPIPAEMRREMQFGTIAVWLVPAGDEPFSLPSLYPPYTPLFDDAFRQAFCETYEKAYSGKRFDVWVRR